MGMRLEKKALFFFYNQEREAIILPKSDRENNLNQQEKYMILWWVNYTRLIQFSPRERQPYKLHFRVDESNSKMISSGVSSEKAG